MFLGVLGSFLSSFIILPRSVFMVQQKAKSYVILTTSEFILRNIFMLILVVFMSKGIEGYLNGQIIGSLILLPIILYLVKSQINFVFVKDHIVSALKYSIPMIPTFISVWVIASIDRIFIERFLDTSQVGIYSLGYKIAMLVSVVSSSMYKAYSPYYFEMATTKLKSDVLPQLKITNTIYLILVIFTSASIALFSKDIIELFFNKQYYESYLIIIIISFAAAVSSFGGIFNLAIYQEKKTIFLFYINIISAFINIVFNFILIEKYGLTGAAIATF